MVDFSSNADCTAYLTTNIGPAATAGDVVTSGIVSPSGAVFSGLTLPANTYYLVLGDPGSNGWFFETGPDVATVPGVTHNIDHVASGGGQNTTTSYKSNFVAWNAKTPWFTGSLATGSLRNPPAGCCWAPAWG